MDPNACFAQFCRATLLCRWKDVDDAVANYNAWIAKGGFSAVDARGCEVVELHMAGRYRTRGDDRYMDVRRLGLINTLGATC